MSCDNEDNNAPRDHDDVQRCRKLDLDGDGLFLGAYSPELNTVLRVFDEETRDLSDWCGMCGALLKDFVRSWDITETVLLTCPRCGDVKEVHPAHGREERPPAQLPPNDKPELLPEDNSAHSGVE